MAVRGIEPSYFAGMPTTQRDPRAGQPGEGYMAAPGQALTEMANRNERRSEVDQNNAFRARDQAHREQQDAQSGARDDRRLAMYQQGEDRRQTQQGFENDRLESADTMRLVQALQSALHDGQKGIAAAIAGELEKRGVPVKGLTARDIQGEAPPQSGQQAAPEAGAPEIGSQDMSFAESGAPEVGGPSPQTHALAQRLRGALSEPSAVGPAVRGALGGVATPSPTPSPKRPSNQDTAMSNQLDQIEKQYLGGLGAAPQRGLVPGGRRSPLRARAIESDQLLSPDDPLNRIVQ